MSCGRLGAARGMVNYEVFRELPTRRWEGVPRAGVEPTFLRSERSGLPLADLGAEFAELDSNQHEQFQRLPTCL
jgi:hypothetical protein